MRSQSYDKTSNIILINTTERVVRRAVEMRSSQHLSRDSVCMCSLCEADVLALSLGLLPSHYYTAYEYADALYRGQSDMVEETIDRSITKVARHPKHHHHIVSGVPGFTLRLVNFCQREGTAIVTSLMRDSDNPCTCVKCLSDTLAYTLNRYPPRYGVERNGVVDLPLKESTRIRREMATILVHAARLVADRPLHS